MNVISDFFNKVLLQIYKSTKELDRCDSFVRGWYLEIADLCKKALLEPESQRENFYEMAVDMIFAYSADELFEIPLTDNLIMLFQQATDLLKSH